jgi:hypothetical protein
MKSAGLFVTAWRKAATPKLQSPVIRKLPEKIPNRILPVTPPNTLPMKKP